MKRGPLHTNILKNCRPKVPRDDRRLADIPERVSRDGILPWRWDVYLIRYAAQPCRTIHCHISDFGTVIFGILHCLVSCNILLQSVRQAFRPDKLCTCNSSPSALQELLTRSETSHCKNAVADYCRRFIAGTHKLPNKSLSLALSRL
jgi:hypothetical protein